VEFGGCQTAHPLLEHSTMALEAGMSWWGSPDGWVPCIVQQTYLVRFIWPRQMSMP